MKILRIFAIVKYNPMPRLPRIAGTAWQHPASKTSEQNAPRYAGRLHILLITNATTFYLTKVNNLPRNNMTIIRLWNAKTNPRLNNRSKELTISAGHNMKNKATACYEEKCHIFAGTGKLSACGAKSPAFFQKEFSIFAVAPQVGGFLICGSFRAAAVIHGHSSMVE